MLSSFRRLQKSKFGTAIIAALFIMILIGFAATGVTNFGSGNAGLGMSSGTLAKVGDQDVSEREMSDALQRQLQVARQQKPDADYASIIGDFDAILGELLDQRTLLAFADKFGFPLSKRLIDAEIAQIPATRGLNGQFSEQSYEAFLHQQRLTDSQVRDIIAGGLLQKLILTPVATNARLPVGVATPYASMLMEGREGEAAIVPLDPFKAGLNPTDAQLQTFYAANRGRYVIPEQRALRIARIGPEQVVGAVATDQEITAYYNANKATYAPSDTRSLSQVVVQDQSAANAIAQRAKGGTTLAAAAAPAGANAAITTLADQTRQAYAGVAGEQAAAAAFSASAGTVIGPVKSDFGWIVAKVESIKAGGGKTVAQARSEIASKLTANKRKTAIEDMVDKVQSALDDGRNFAEAVAAAKLPVTTTPLITANGAARADAAYKLPPELAPILKPGFEIAPSDPPELVALPGEAGYAVVSPGEVVAAAPAPLASIRQQVASDWVNDQAGQRARVAATQIAAKANGGTTLAEALKSAGVSLPAPRPIAARRIQLVQAQGPVPPAMRTLFTTAAGKAQVGGNPQSGYFIVKVNKITPGNAVLAPGLIGQMQKELGQATSQDYAQEFLAALRGELKAKRNDSAIQAFKTRILSSGG